MTKNAKFLHLFILSVIIIFGVATIISGGNTLFTSAGLQAKGHVVPLVLKFNFIAGFFYILVAIFAQKCESYAKILSIIIASLNFLVFMYLFYFIYNDGQYESRTVIAMSFRTIFWVAIAIYFGRRPQMPKCSIQRKN